MIEFAIGSTVLIPLLFGIADFGRLFYTAIEVANAAAAGAMYGSRTAANMADSAGIASAAINDAPELPGLQVTSSTVCQDKQGNSASCGSGNVYQYVKVTASYTFNTLLNYPAIPSSVSLSRTVMIRGV